MIQGIVREMVNKELKLNKSEWNGWLWEPVGEGNAQKENNFFTYYLIKKKNKKKIKIKWNILKMWSF